MRFEDIKTEEDGLRFLKTLRKLKPVEIPGLKEKYEEIKKIGYICQEKHEDTLSFIMYYKYGKEGRKGYIQTIIGEPNKISETGKQYRDIYYIDPCSYGVVYIEHRGLIDNDSPVIEWSIERAYIPPHSSKWEHLWKEI